MLRVLLVSLLFAEALLYLWLGRRLTDAGWQPAAVVGVVAAIAVLWRFSHAFTTYLIASYLRARDKRDLPLGNSLKALASELKARVVSYNWSQPWPSLALGRDPAGPREGTPILLVHGFFSNRGMWVRFRRRLAEAGLGPVYTITLEPLLGSLDTMAAQLARRVEAVRAETGCEKLVIVAHSMGGLVTRRFMAQGGQAHVAQLVTLGSPHHGTRIAKLGVGHGAVQMRQGGSWLAELERQERTSPPAMPALSIYTLNDDLVYPPETSVLPWAENMPVSAVGHVALLYSEPVTQRVIAFLRGNMKP